jgi:hypothetical protein
MVPQLRGLPLSSLVLLLASVLSFRARIKAAVKQQVDRVNKMIMGLDFGV